MGHRKKLERRVKMLQHGLDPMGEDDDGNSSHSSSHSSVQSSHSTNSKASHKVDPLVPLSTSSSSSSSSFLFADVSPTPQSSASASVASEGFQAKMKKDKVRTTSCMWGRKIVSDS